jgi:hypothetical protein
LCLELAKGMVIYMVNLKLISFSDDLDRDYLFSSALGILFISSKLPSSGVIKLIKRGIWDEEE